MTPVGPPINPAGPPIWIHPRDSSRTPHLGPSHWSLPGIPRPYKVQTPSRSDRCSGMKENPVPGMRNPHDSTVHLPGIWVIPSGIRSSSGFNFIYSGSHSQTLSVFFPARFLLGGAWEVPIPWKTGSIQKLNLFLRDKSHLNSTKTLWDREGSTNNKMGNLVKKEPESEIPCASLPQFCVERPD